MCIILCYIIFMNLKCCRVVNRGDQIWSIHFQLFISLENKKVVIIVKITTQRRYGGAVQIVDIQHRYAGAVQIVDIYHRFGGAVQISSINIQNRYRGGVQIIDIQHRYIDKEVGCRYPRRPPRIWRWWDAGHWAGYSGQLARDPGPDNTNPAHTRGRGEEEARAFKYIYPSLFSTEQKLILQLLFCELFDSQLMHSEYNHPHSPCPMQHLPTSPGIVNFANYR